MMPFSKLLEFLKRVLFKSWQRKFDGYSFIIYTKNDFDVNHRFFVKK